MSIVKTSKQLFECESGFALIVVIMFLLTVSALMTPFVLIARSEFTHAVDSYRKNRLDLLAEGLGQVLARELALPDSDKRTAELELNSEPMRCSAGEVTIEARVQDQRGLVDLNAADEAQLRVAFVAIGMDNVKAQSLARLVTKYRDSDIANENTAANQEDIWDGPKSAPFNTIEELYDLKPLAGKPLQKIAESFTIYNEEGLLLATVLPRELSKLLPQVPSSIYPYIRSEPFGTPKFRIDIAAMIAPSGISGYFGAIVNALQDDEGTFAWVERMANPNFLPGGSLRSGRKSGCETLFGPAVTTLLQVFEK